MTDRSGNTGSSSVDVVVNTVTPVIGINTLAADDVINAAEKGEDLLLSGTSNQPEGTTITVNLNGINYTATTDVSGNWSVTVPASAVSALGEANYTVTASVTDNVGNSAAATHDVLVDSSLPVVTLNNFAGDNIVNAAEVAAGQTLTGKVSNAASGDTVTIILGGQTYTATVQDDLTSEPAVNPESVNRARQRRPDRIGQRDERARQYRIVFPRMSPLTPSCPACALIPSPVTTSLTLLNTRRTSVISGTSTDPGGG